MEHTWDHTDWDTNFIQPTFFGVKNVEVKIEETNVNDTTEKNTNDYNMVPVIDWEWEEKIVGVQDLEDMYSEKKKKQTKTRTSLSHSRALPLPP